MSDGITPPSPLPQAENVDLTRSTLGRGKSDKAPDLTHHSADYRSPAAMMRAMGFCPNKYMTPLQFLIAVFNDDLDLVFKSEKKREMAESRGGISLEYRVECAKSAARYFHMEMPKVSITDDAGNFGESLAQAARAGNERLRTKTMIIETVERISPDVPLPAASYPPIYNKADQVVDANGMIEGEVLPPEGDKDYNPDAD